jgi:hypothetical protein
MEGLWNKTFQKDNPWDFFIFSGDFYGVQIGRIRIILIPSQFMSRFDGDQDRDYLLFNKDHRD